MELIDLYSKYLPSFLKGLVVTLELTVTSTIVSVVLGLVGAFGRLSTRRVVRAASGFYVEIVRATPLLLQLFLVYFSLTEFGIVLSGFTAATMALGLFGGAFLTEIFRGGIQGVDRGQVEAALAMGMSDRQVMRKIVLPQAIRLVLPPLANQAIITLKNTSIVVTIAVPDLMYAAYNAASITYRSVEFYALAGVIYLAICYPLSRLLGFFEDRTNIHTLA
jgi:His/Glu/Gln/Arg/opine family amino acid ABC transporter permease subunit